MISQSSTLATTPRESTRIVYYNHFRLEDSRVPTSHWCNSLLHVCGFFMHLLVVAMVIVRWLVFRQLMSNSSFLTSIWSWSLTYKAHLPSITPTMLHPMVSRAIRLYESYSTLYFPRIWYPVTTWSKMTEWLWRPHVLLSRSYTPLVLLPSCNLSLLQYGCTTNTLTKRTEKKLSRNYMKTLCAVLNKSWKQHPTKQQLYGN